MKTKRKKKYKSKAGSYARKLDEPIPIIRPREDIDIDFEQIELRRLLPNLNPDEQRQILIELLADEQFRNDIELINLPRLNQLNQVNQIRGQNFRRQEELGEQAFNRRVRQRRGASKKRKKPKRKKPKRRETRRGPK
tara:strand:+ start:209 stop:619 length:411 start_codon:yes stop_codon:yes gene_type:complete